MGDLARHDNILTTWNPALEPSEGLATEGKGTSQTMPNRTSHAAAAALDAISSLARGLRGSET